MSGQIIAFVGPSGCGKTRFVSELLTRWPQGYVQRMVSITTRDLRDTDPPGEYRYVSHHEFDELLADAAFCWHTKLHDTRYGTLRESIAEAMEFHGITVMHLEINTVQYLVEAAGEKVKLFFPLVPIDQLDRRLRERDPGRSEEYYQRRINECREWESRARSSGLPYRFFANPDGRFEMAMGEVMNELQRLACQEAVA